MPERVQQATVGAARETFEADSHVLAAWLEGSLAAGEGDEWSDVDLHLAVADEDFDAVAGDARSLLRRVGAPISWIDVPVPNGLLLAATLTVGDELSRLDLMVERRPSVAGRPRRSNGWFLFDRDEVAADVAAGPRTTFDAADYLRNTMRTCFFGAMWPVRMTGRQDWSALLWNDATVLSQFIIPAMLIADGSSEFHRELTTRPRFLRPERTAEVRALEAEMLRAFAGIEHGPDLDVLAAFHARMLGTVFAWFRRACAACGETYPEAAEQAYRRYFEQALGRAIPSESATS